MTLDALRQICRALPGATEDVKWGHDLCFSIGGKMFAAVNLEPPHQLGFKCSPEMFADLTEREGIIPAPYLARAMWVQESALGAALDRRELEPLLRAAYELVIAKLPKSRRPGAAPTGKARKKPAAKKRAQKRRSPQPTPTRERAGPSSTRRSGR